MPPVQRGLLVIADISGYTRFVGGVELEHATDIVASLLAAVTEQLAGVAPLSKLEGDAAFCAAATTPAADSVQAALFGCYDAFRRRLRDAQHLTTCTCSACAQMSTLDLKVAVHHGQFVTHVVAGHDEVTGADVIVVHRLLKNSVTDATGVRGYAFLTDAAVEAMELPVDGWRAARHHEDYDDVGKVDGYVLDLATLWHDEQDRTAVVIGDDAPISFRYEMAAPPPVVWEWFADPRKRQQWNAADRIDVERGDGPSAVGTTNHCIHGRSKIDEEIVDWKPFHYATLRVTIPVGTFLMTTELQPCPGGSVVEIRIAPDGTGLRRVGFKVATPKIRKNMSTGMARLTELIKASPS